MKSYKRLFQTWVVAVLATIPVVTLQAQRETKTINDSWEFRKAADEQWQAVNIPHTFNLDAYQQRNYYQGKGFYKRTMARKWVRMKADIPLSLWM